MLKTAREIKKAIALLEDFYDPVTSSLVLLSPTRSKASHATEPFKPGFLDTIDERHEILRRLALLDERKRTILLLWHLETLAKDQIAERVGLSRMHVYRLHGQAIQEIVDMGEEQ
ncbi:MAG: hypothetical protein C4521_03545 [Actinobacteria bacterium]|nr:MAG: hypothetical protein C4521_03545 [Actinomycetota bacterium]